MLYCIIMKGSRTNSKYKDSHKKSEAKHLTRSSVPDTIFVDKRQATSDKRQATSDKRQATSDKRQATSDKRQATSDKRQSGISAQFARITTHPNNTHFSQNNLGFVRGAATPLSPRLFYVLRGCSPLKIPPRLGVLFSFYREKK